MITEKQLRIAKAYLKIKILEGLYDKDIFTMLDEGELVALYQITKEQEWKSI